MEYSKELHEMLKNQSYDNYPRLRDIYTACLLDEIERLQREVDRLTPKNASEVLAGFKVLISAYIPADTILIPRIAAQRIGLVSPPLEGEK